MNIRRNAAALALTGGALAGGAVLAAPASATVVNIACPSYGWSQGVQVFQDNPGHDSYCYGLRADGSTSPGWANIGNSYEVSSGVNTGFVTDPYFNVEVTFTPHTLNYPADHHEWLTRWVFISS